jgi:hypothetical protein
MSCSTSLSDTAIVLTGTIVPNTNLHTRYSDREARRKEYLEAIHYYRSFAPVFFLENSSHSLSEDKDFKEIPNVTIRKFSASYASKGKGFQEFEMLDRWIKTETSLPKNWIKITGRYLYLEFEKIWHECLESQNVSLIINQYLFANHADTALFYINSNFYKNYMSGLYLNCNDRKGLSIEKVLSTHLKKIPKDRFKRFVSHTNCVGIAGHTGKEIHNRWIDGVNSALRDINYRVDRRYIWLSF